MSVVHRHTQFVCPVKQQCQSKLNEIAFAHQWPTTHHHHHCHYYHTIFHGKILPLMHRTLSRPVVIACIYGPIYICDGCNQSEYNEGNKDRQNKSTYTIALNFKLRFSLIDNRPSLYKLYIQHSRFIRKKNNYCNRFYWSDGKI